MSAEKWEGRRLASKFRSLTKLKSDSGEVLSKLNMLEPSLTDSRVMDDDALPTDPAENDKVV